jgi:photosystem II stability/assembly factor-like uncharacterized protein
LPGGAFDETLVAADGVLFANSPGGGMFRSLDTGKSWRPFPVPGGDNNLSIENEIFYDAVSGLVYAFSGDGAYSASPRAGNWTWVYDNIPQYFSIQGSTLVFSDAVGVMISGDGGKFWKGIDGGRFPNRGKVLAAGSCVYIGNYGGPISVSCDGGNTWKTPVGDTLSNSAQSMVAYQGAVLALTGSGLVRSLDSGKTWVHWIGNLSGDSTLRDLSVTGNSLIASSWEPNGFSRSVDGGLTWVTHPFPYPEGLGHYPPALAEVGEKLVFHSPQGVAISEDGGLTWKDVQLRRISGAIQALAVRGPAFLALTEQGIFASGDSGITWDISLPAVPDPGHSRAAPPPLTHLKKILVLDKSQGGANGHLESRRDFNRALQGLAADKGFSITYIGQNDPATVIATEFSPDNLATCQAVLFGYNDAILLTVAERSFTRTINAPMGDDHPVMWTKAIGKGRVVNFSLGHSWSGSNVYTEKDSYLTHVL